MPIFICPNWGSCGNPRVHSIIRTAKVSPGDGVPYVELRRHDCRRTFVDANLCDVTVNNTPVIFGSQEIQNGDVITITFEGTQRKLKAFISQWNHIWTDETTATQMQGKQSVFFVARQN